MNPDALLDLAAGPRAGRLAAVLLHFLWQGAAVAAAAAAAGSCIPPARFRLRYAADAVGFAALVACPAVTWWVTDGAAGSTVASVIRVAPTGTAAVDPGPFPPNADGDGPAGAVSEPPRSDARTRSDGAGGPRRPVPVRAWLVAAWAAGVGVGTLRLLLGGWAVWRLRRTSLPCPAAVATRFRGLAGRFGFRRVPAVRLSTRLSDAAAAGWVRPVVLLPAAWALRCPPDLLDAALAHELAHLRRGDPWVNLLQRVAETLLFYHPAVWWLSARLRRGREFCRDADAAAALGDPAALARCLAWAAEQRPAPPTRPPRFSLPLSERTTMLTDRVHALLGDPRRRPDRSAVPPAAALLAAPLLWAAAAWAAGPPVPPADDASAGAASRESPAVTDDAPASDADDAPPPAAEPGALFGSPFSQVTGVAGRPYRVVHDPAAGTVDVYRPLNAPELLGLLTPVEREELAGRLRDRARAAAGGEVPPFVTPMLTLLAEGAAVGPRDDLGISVARSTGTVPADAVGPMPLARDYGVSFAATSGPLRVEPETFVSGGDRTKRGVFWAAWRRDPWGNLPHDLADRMFDSAVDAVTLRDARMPDEVAEFWARRLNVPVDEVRRKADAALVRRAAEPHAAHPALRLNVPVTLHLDGVSRGEALRRLGGAAGFPVLAHRPSLTAGGIDLGEAVSVHVDEVPLSTVLFRLIPPARGGQWMMLGGVPVAVHADAMRDVMNWSVALRAARLNDPDAADAPAGWTAGVYPSPGEPAAVAAALREVLGDGAEVGVDGERLRVRTAPLSHPLVEELLHAWSDGDPADGDAADGDPADGDPASAADRLRRRLSELERVITGGAG